VILYKQLNQLIVIVFSIFILILRIGKSNSNTPVFGNYDSASYFNFSLSGGLRMPLITLFFSTLRENYNIMIFQTIVSVLAFLILSLSILNLGKSNKINLFSALLVLILGNSNQIVYVDTTIDSESLQISSLALLSSAIILIFKKNPSNRNYYFLFLTFFIFSGIKSMNLVLTIFLVILMLIFKKIKRDFKIIIPFILIVVINSLYFFNSKVTPELNTSAIINSRLWEKVEWRQQIVDSNFPVEARSIFVRFESDNLGLPPDTAVSKLAKYQEWYSSNGKLFLPKFMLRNIDYTIVGPIFFSGFFNEVSLNKTIWRGAAVGYLNYDTYNSQNSKFIRLSNFFWPLERSNGYLFVGIMLTIISSALLITFLKNLDLEVVKLLVIFTSFVFFSGYFAWWFGSTPSDLGRQQLTFSIGLRILFIISLNLLFSEIISKNFFKQFLKRKLILS